MSNKRDFAKDTVVFGLGNGIKKLIGLFLLPFYTRALSPSDYGIMDSLATFAMLFSAVINVGLDSSTGFYFFKAQTEKEKGQILYTHLLLRIISFVPPLILSFFSSAISQLLFKSDKYTWIVFISIMIIPLDLIMNEQSHLYRYFRKPWQYNFVTICKSVINIAIGIILVVILKRGIIGAQYASLFSTALVIIGSFVFFSRKKYTYEFDWHWARKLLKYGFPLIWAGLAGWVFNSSDRFFLLHYSTLEQIGYYSIGNTFSQPILLINMAVQMSFGVIFYKIYNEEKDPAKPDSKAMAIDAFNLYLGISVLLATFLSIFGSEIINLFATKDYGPGALSIPFLVLSYIAAQGFQTMGPGIELAEKTWHFTWITLLIAIINTVLNFMLIPVWGYIGAAISTLISFMIYWIIKVYVANRFFQVSYNFGKIALYFFMGLGISCFLTFNIPGFSKTNLIFLKIISFLLLVISTFWLDFLSIKIFRQIFDLIKTSKIKSV